MAKTDGTPGGEETLLTPSPMKVEVRLKGDASFEPLTGKAAFKLKFKKTERFLGLRKMTLNNMHEDASMIHETLAYASFRANGVPAPRTSFAYVYVNGEDFGLELNIETVDADLLEKRFGSFDSETQHLYEGEDGTDVIPGDAPEFEVDEGEEGNIADLEALIEAVNSEGPEPWSTRVAPFADLGEMTAEWAVEKYIGHWDGYAGQPGQNGHQPNNYYLASLPGGEFRMLPWGTDETFQQNRHIPFEGRAGVLFNFCMEDPACATTYWKSLDAAVTAIEGLDLDAMAARLADLQAPWQQIEKGNDRHRWDIEHIEDGVAETRDFLTSRTQEARDWLALNDPRPQTTIDTPPPAASNDPTPTITFSSSKPNSSFQCKVDAGAFAPCTSPITLAALADGPHSFEVLATDALGNTDPDAALANFSVDTVPPRRRSTPRRRPPPTTRPRRSPSPRASPTRASNARSTPAPSPPARARSPSPPSPTAPTASKSWPPTRSATPTPTPPWRTSRSTRCPPDDDRHPAAGRLQRPDPDDHLLLEQAQLELPMQGRRRRLRPLHEPDHPRRPRRRPPQLRSPGHRRARQHRPRRRPGELLGRHGRAPDDDHR